ncbi:MAG: ribosome-associated translation inhibitor RaiA [Planctomycetes bacterium]|nr:ribosome-associated translation inhibitor RaiA [Planctomycetota bacterium]
MTPNADVKVEVTARGKRLSPRTRDYVAEKAGKLARYSPHVMGIHAIVQDDADAKRVEILVHVRTGKQIVAREQCASVLEAVDILVEKIERLLKKDKEKNKQRHRGLAGRRGKETAVELTQRVARDEEEPIFEEVVAAELRPAKQSKAPAAGATRPVRRKKARK